MNYVSNTLQIGVFVAKGLKVHGAGRGCRANIVYHGVKVALGRAGPHLDRRDVGPVGVEHDGDRADGIVATGPLCPLQIAVLLFFVHKCNLS